MMRDPYSGHQVRFLRQLPRYDNPISGPYTGAPGALGDKWVVVGMCVVVMLISLSHIFGWPLVGATR